MQNIYYFKFPLQKIKSFIKLHEVKGHKKFKNEKLFQNLL